MGEGGRPAGIHSGGVRRGRDAADPGRGHAGGDGPRRRPGGPSPAARPQVPDVVGLPTLLTGRTATRFQAERQPLPASPPAYHDGGGAVMTFKRVIVPYEGGAL